MSHNQITLPSNLERGLIEEPMILEDAIGGRASVHLQFVTLWEALESILEFRFRQLQGHKKIFQKQYGIQDEATGREVERSRTWQSAFLPGQRVEMSMVFHSEEPTDSDPNSVTCPGCHTPATNSTDSDIHCTKCSIWYLRITVVEEKASSEIPPIEDVLKFVPASSSDKDPINPNGKRVSSDDGSDDEAEDVRDFKRVRIMSTSKRNKHSLDFDHTGKMNPDGYKFRMTVSKWQDERTYCFQVAVRGTIVACHEDDHMINASRLLVVANITRSRRDELLKSEPTLHIHRNDVPHLRGTWMPFERALELANRLNITPLLYPLFVYEIIALLKSPLNQTEAPYSEYDTVDGRELKRSTDLQDVREPPVAGPFHTSWEAAIEEDFMPSAAVQDKVDSYDISTSDSA